MVILVIENRRILIIWFIYDGFCKKCYKIFWWISSINLENIEVIWNEEKYILLIQNKEHLNYKGLKNLKLRELIIKSLLK